jgi:hypothetical protein
MIIEEQINTSSIASPARDMMMREEQEPPRIVAVVPVVAVEEVKQDVLEGQGQRRVLLD